MARKAGLEDFWKIFQDHPAMQGHCILQIGREPPYLYPFVEMHFPQWVVEKFGQIDSDGHLFCPLGWPNKGLSSFGKTLNGIQPNFSALQVFSFCLEALSQNMHPCCHFIFLPGLRASASTWTRLNSGCVFPSFEVVLLRKIPRKRLWVKSATCLKTI